MESLFYVALHRNGGEGGSYWNILANSLASIFWSITRIARVASWKEK